ncbi:SIMPL domain-containing protein [Qipengyuania sp. MTN3-11]|uniref:SIMPL domain-containing protein n=1 Tax=Qipengyuania sp. MTN3-11 TaxID=3056557 RepID=UPI0036F3BEA2
MRAAFLFLAASAATLPLAPLSAQVVQPEVAIPANHTVLTVNGSGESMRAPDMAIFSAGVTSQGTTAADALGQNSRAMEQVIAALRRAGIAERDIQTSNLSINPVYRDPNREAALRAQSGQPYVPPAPEDQIPTIIGYQVNNTVSVRQRELGEYGRIIDTLASAGANQINGPNFQLDEPEPALDEARRDAMADARRKAELLAGSAGLRIVRIVSITEGGGHYGPPPMAFARMAADSAPPPPPPAPVQPGELEMNASVTVVYELAP